MEEKLTLLQRLQWHLLPEYPPEWRAVLLKMSLHGKPNLYEVGYWTGRFWSTQAKYDMETIPFAWQYIITQEYLIEEGLTLA